MRPEEVRRIDFVDRDHGGESRYCNAKNGVIFEAIALIGREPAGIMVLGVEVLEVEKEK